ncbi:HAD superfamily hydrolase (TIGR01484 family) [Couchioplanes caeruleus]|uniref:HAD family hydrolase n=3 Tax=Couchioplanes caeruleus TaxID=56438 RepID=A0A1K0FJD0_9ACTN|nr:hypothetical protein BG844_18605 [Couchioplanes caeruleus subsp. caeruleus]ROP30677.1 HAD superfamily hydrolase (TIGR01484 family) [Couchioplanes caeruleus]
MLCLDIDGTIADKDGIVSDGVVEGIRSLDRAGVHIVLATGRSVVATIPVFEAIGIAGYAVCSNGSLTAWIDGMSAESFRIVDSVTFNPAEVLDAVCVGLPGVKVALEGAWLGFRVNASFPAGELMGQQHMHHWEELRGHQATRVTLRHPDRTARELMAELERMGIKGAAYDVEGRSWVDITPPGVSKASALEKIRMKLGVAADATVACGDQVNDLEMFSWASYSAAMGNAPEDVKGKADRVVGDVRADGILMLFDAIAPERVRDA